MDASIAFNSNRSFVLALWNDLEAIRDETENIYHEYDHNYRPLRPLNYRKSIFVFSTRWDDWDHSNYEFINVTYALGGIYI